MAGGVNAGSADGTSNIGTVEGEGTASSNEGMEGSKVGGRRGSSIKTELMRKVCQARFAVEEAWMVIVQA
jgi:hypothetical protein